MGPTLIERLESILGDLECGKFVATVGVLVTLKDALGELKRVQSPDPHWTKQANPVPASFDPFNALVGLHRDLITVFGDALKEAAK